MRQAWNIGIFPFFNTVPDYLGNLYDCVYKYKIINVHRSALSFSLVPINGHNVGNHPMVGRLLRGVLT